MSALILADLAFGVLALLVVLFVAYPYRRRRAPRGARRLNRALATVASRVDPGDSPPYGVLGRPELSRRMARRFELAEHRVKRSALTAVGRGPG